MQLSESYYMDEVRDGFYIPGLMKRCWAASIEVLEFIDLVCTKHNIRYFAFAGTLLGAIRHGGVVPWDDDLDICMLREDYQRFLEVIDSELPEGFDVLEIHRDTERVETIIRLNNSKTICFDKGFLEKYHGFPYISGVDIFPLDKISPNKEDEKERCEKVRLILMALKVLKEEGSTACIEQVIQKVEEQCHTEIDRNKPIQHQFVLLLEKLFTQFNGEEADEIGLISVWAVKGEGNVFPSSCFTHSFRFPFEYIDIPVPGNYEKILEMLYGDYIHPVRSWFYHDYPGYQVGIDALKKELGFEYPAYLFSKKDLQKDDSKKERSLREQAKRAGNLFVEILEQCTEKKQMADYQEIVNTFIQIQENAIEIGTLIEKSLQKETDSVKTLEVFCEQLYQVCEELLNCMDVLHIQEDIVRLKITATQYLQNVNQELFRKKEIVFLPFCADSWWTMQDLWEKYQENPEYDVYVIPIPYFVKNFHLETRKVFFECNGFPEDVSLTSYKDYDITLRQPDIIVTQNPYDEYNLSVSIHPDFYTSKLKNYTEKLIYIPYFQTDDIEAGDEKGIDSMKYFVTVPGVVQADQIYLPSEIMKDRYVEALSRFAGKDTCELWKEKIQIKPLVEKDIYRNMPKSWRQLLEKEDGSNKKLILYYFSGSKLYENIEKALEKLEKTIAIFADRAEYITVVWKYDVNVNEYIKKHKPKAWEKYCELVKRFCEEGHGIYIDAEESVSNLAKWCDGYYGDAGVLAKECICRHKPVMIQNLEV